MPEVTAQRVSAAPPPPDRIKVTLDLSVQEAQDLMDLCQFVGGAPETTRGVFDRLNSALSHLGFTYGVPRHTRGNRGSGRVTVSEGVYFRSW